MSSGAEEKEKEQTLEPHSDNTALGSSDVSASESNSEKEMTDNFPDIDEKQTHKEIKEIARKVLNYESFDISSEDELDEETAIECLFNISRIRERRLLMQIIYKVLDSKSNIYIRSDHVRNGRRKRWIGCRATVAQKIEIEFLFDFYKRLYKREEEFFFDTFIQKHELFGRLKEGEEPKSLSKEMAMKMVALMKGMSDETPLRQITEQSAASKRQ